MHYEQLSDAQNTALHRSDGRGMPGCSIFYHLHWTDWCSDSCVASLVACRRFPSSTAQSPETPNTVSTISSGWESFARTLRELDRDCSVCPSFVRLMIIYLFEMTLCCLVCLMQYICFLFSWNRRPQELQTELLSLSLRLFQKCLKTI